MSNVQFSNFAATTLASGINASVTSLTVSTGTGVLFPTLAGAQYFYAVIVDAATGTTREVIKVTARSTDTFTITRGQDGTTGAIFITGDKVELRLTAAGIATFATTETAQTFAGVQTFSSAPVLSVPLATSGGGTGVANNAASTLTISGAFGTTLTVGATTALTLPASGTVATLAGSETFTNKTLTNPTVTNYVESVVAVGTVGASSTLSLTNGTVQTATLTASTPCTFTMPTATAGKSFILILTQAATGMTTATFTSVKFPGGTAPTITATASAVDIISFVANGTSWFGTAAQAFA